MRLFVPLTLLVALVVGCGESAQVPRAQVPAEYTSTDGITDPDLRRLRQEASRVIDGGTEGFRRRLAELRGTPVVVNQWASWCGPCRYEFPFFQRQALEHGARVGFLGIDARDSRGEAEAFLQEFPTPFPHYFDPDVKIARTFFKGGRAWPTTAFFGADGKLVFTHVGAYRDEEQLAEQIRKYALDD